MTDHKYEIEKTNDRGIILWIDNKPSVCPFTPPIMVPGQIPGTASMMRMPCSTQCPLAKIGDSPYESTNEVKPFYYITSCGHHDNSKLVIEKETPKQPTQSGLLKSL